MIVSELWRYPVKSLAGERLERARVEANGIHGDRIVQVAGPNGTITSRTKFRLLGLSGTLGDEDEPLVDGRRWDTEDSAEAIRRAAGEEAQLVRYEGPERFDVLPLLVATDGAIASFGRDGRRLRPNIVVGGVEGLAERDWPGARLRIGEVVIGLDSLRQRCVMTTFDPDTQSQDVDVLRDINGRFGGKLALNAFVVNPGEIHRGQQVELLRADQTDLLPSRGEPE